MTRWLCLIWLVACSSAPKAPGARPEDVARFEELVRAVTGHLFTLDPARAVGLGHHEHDGVLPDRSPEALTGLIAQLERDRAALEAQTALSPQQALDHEHVRAMRLLVPVDYPGLPRPAPLADTPVRLSEMPGGIRRRAPVLGEHTAEVLGAWGLTEAGAGSDAAGMRTTAVRQGACWAINGAKTFISNGILCDLCIVVAKTEPDATPPHSGISLLLVGMMFQAGLTLVTVKLVLIAVFVLYTSPMTTHALARACLTADVQPAAQDRTRGGDDPSKA